MKIIRYFFEFIIVITFFFIFKIIGYKNASNLGNLIGKKIGPLFRSRHKIQENLKNSNISNSEKDIKIIINNMWGNYGRILSEYVYLKQFREDKLNEFIEIKGLDILNKIKKNNEQVIFISGHFNNFELMAMYIEKFGIDLAAIYRPLNNKFLNPLMEKIREKYICKKQVKKGVSGTREILRHFKNGSSIALMIDQSGSEGIKTDFFGYPALTTTIPAQFIKKFNTKIVPVYIERTNNNLFKLEFYEAIKFDKNEDLQSITLKLNKILEKMILKNPDQWIWTHNRWK